MHAKYVHVCIIIRVYVLVHSICVCAINMCPMHVCMYVCIRICVYMCVHAKYVYVHHNAIHVCTLRMCAVLCAI